MGNYFWQGLGWGASIATYMQGSHAWCIFPSFDFFVIWIFASPNPLLFTTKAHPNLKKQYQERVQVALDFSLGIKDFDEFIDPRSFYDHYLGPEPLDYA